MGPGLPRRDVGIIIAVAALLAGGIVTSAVLLPASDHPAGESATRYLEGAGGPPALPARHDPHGIAPVAPLFPVTDTRFASRP
jgi:hypothetical protein